MWKMLKRTWKSLWTRVKNWFKDSETLFWARLQVFVGILIEVVAMTDLSPVLPPAWIPIWFIFSGVLTEILRRRRDPDM